MPRIKLKGTVANYHCIARMVDGLKYLQDEELEHLQKLLRRVCAFCSIQLLAHCLMGSHFHLLVRVPDKVRLPDKELLKKVKAFYGAQHSKYLFLLDYCQKHGHLPERERNALLARMGDLSVFMKELKQRFTRYYNALHERHGTLWAERFRSILLEDRSQALKAVSLYIDLNPLRAGITENPAQYRFCGIAEALAGSQEAREGLLCCLKGSDWEVESPEYLKALYIQSADPGHSSKKALSRERILEKLKSGDGLPLEEALRLRVRYFTAGLILGSRGFVEEIFQAFRHHFGPKRSTGARKPRALGRALGDLRVARDLQVNVVK